MKNFTYIFFAVILLSACKQSPESSRTNDSTMTDQVDASTPSFIDRTLTAKDYNAKLASLPKTISSSGEALEIFRTKFNKQHALSCDSAFDFFFAFQLELIGTLQEQFETRTDYETVASGGDRSQLPNETQAYLQSLTDNAMLVAEEEGMTFIDSDPAVVKEQFHQFMSPAGQRYIEQWKTEMEEPFAIDAGITISIPALIDRLVYWDNFLVQNPNTIFSAKAQSKYNSYLYFLLIGMDNTPAFDYNDEGTPEQVNEEFLNAYQEFVAKYPPSNSRGVIESYLSVLLANDYKKTADVDKFVERYSNF